MGQGSKISVDEAGGLPLQTKIGSGSSPWPDGVVLNLKPEDMMITLPRASALCLVGLFLPAAAEAADLENPPVFVAGAVLGQAAEGPGYKVEPKVGSDGYLRIYRVETP